VVVRSRWLRHTAYGHQRACLPGRRASGPRLSHAIAERVYGDAAASPADRHAATLARWIIKMPAREVHVRRLQREVRLPGLTTAEAIHATARALVEAGWLIASKERVRFQQRGRAVYAVNPKVFEVGT
jgi:hypothetical protein